MIIIVDGIDRVGKTTLIDKIIDKYKGQYDFKKFKDDSRYVHTHGDMMVNTEKNNTIMNMIEECVVDNVILDRFHMTEFVYGGCDRAYKNEYMFDIDRRLAKLPVRDRHPINVILIYMRPVDIERSSAEHGKNLSRHLRWYEDFYNVSRIKNKVTVDYLTMDDALAFIDQVLWAQDMTPNLPDNDFDSGMMMPDSDSEVEEKEESEEEEDAGQEADSNVHNKSV